MNGLNTFSYSSCLSGEISTRLALDREQQSSYQLVVVVQDGGTPPRSATGTAHISVLDENDNAPTFTHVRPDRELNLQVRTKRVMWFCEICV